MAIHFLPTPTIGPHQYDMDAIRADSAKELPADATPLDVALMMAREIINNNATGCSDGWDCQLKIQGDRLHVCDEYLRDGTKESIMIDIYPAGITPIEPGKRTGRNGHPATETDREARQRPDERIRST